MFPSLFVALTANCTISHTKLWQNFCHILTLGVGGVDPVNNIILYIIILYSYIIYTYAAYGIPIDLRAASSSSISISIASASNAAACVNRVYDVMTMSLTTRVQMYQLFHPPKNWVVRSPPYFAQGILWMPPKTLKFSRKSDDYFRRNFFKPKIFFQGSPFIGGPNAKILFLSTQRPPTAQKIWSLPDLPFRRYKGWKFQLSHLFPKNWAARSPPYFAQSITGMTPKNP